MRFHDFGIPRRAKPSHSTSYRLAGELLEERRMMSVTPLPGPIPFRAEGVIIPGQEAALETGGIYSRPDQVVVDFTMPIGVAGGATGVHSGLNLANWGLMRGDADVSHLIESVEINGDKATLHFKGPLGVGGYQVVVRDNLRSASNEQIVDSEHDSPDAVRLSFGRVMPLVARTAGSSIDAESLTKAFELERLQADAQGNYAILFQRLTRDDAGKSASSLRIQRYNSAGQTIGGEFNLVDNFDASTFGIATADMAMNAAGQFIVSWTLAGDARIYLRRFTAAGAPSGETFHINLASSVLGDPRLAIDDAGRAAVAWSFREGTLEQARVQLLGTGNNLVGGPISLGQGNGAQVARNGNGEFVVTWNAPAAGNLYYQRIRHDGVRQGPQVAMTFNSDLETLGDVVSLPGGGFAIASLYDKAGSREVRIRRFNAEGNSTGPLIIAADLSHFDHVISPIRLAVGPDGQMIVRWDMTTHYPGVNGLWPYSSTWYSARVLDANGRPLGDVFNTAAHFAIAPTGQIIAATHDPTIKLLPIEDEMISPIGVTLIENIYTLDMGRGQQINLRHFRFPDDLILDLNGGPDGVEMKLNFVPGGSPIRLADAQGLVIQSTGETLTSATLTIEGYQPGDVLLTYSTNPKIHWSFAGGVLRLTGTDTVANYQALLRDFWFKTTADRPAGSKLRVQFIISDGVRDSTPAYSHVSIHVPGRSSIAGRRLFYNASVYDRWETITPADDAAIAPDKVALLPGQTATKANYTGYSRGINGIMIDLAGEHGEITVDDFIFRVGNSNNPATWETARAPRAVVVRPGAGAGGSDRIVITWGDGSIQNTWLQVIVLDNGDTGLAEPDIFYFGSRVGDSGNESNRAQPQSAEALQTINLIRGDLDGGGGVEASIADPLDFNRDGRVNSSDLLVIFNSIREQRDPLNMIRTPGGQAGMEGAVILDLYAEMTTFLPHLFQSVLIADSAPLAAAFADWSDDDATEARLPLVSASPLLEEPDER